MTEAEHGHEVARWSVGRAVGSLLGASALAAYMSEILVGAAEGTGTALGMSEVFIGVVFLAIIGGAAESGSAVAMARKNKLDLTIGIVFLAIVGGAAESGSAVAMARKNKVDLTIGIALGSSIQIILFVAPVLVFASYFIAPQPLELSFGRAEVGSLFIAVLLGAMVCGDGQANWYKGVQLIIVYSIIALMFYFLPGAIP